MEEFIHIDTPKNGGRIGYSCPICGEFIDNPYAVYLKCYAVCDKCKAAVLYVRNHIMKKGDENE